MAKKKETFAENSEQMFEETVGKLEVWFLKNQKRVTTAAVAIVVLVGGYFGYKFMYQQPRENAAQEEIWFAENCFMRDSLNLALNGDGVHSGLIDIITDYSGTDAANMAHFYIGKIYLIQGQFEDALEHLKKFQSDDLFLAPMSIALIGDCYAELNNMSEALSYYEKAASTHKNELVTPMALMKAAVLCEVQNDYQKALDLYKRIRDEYLRSPEAREIDKNIAMMEAKLN